MKTLQESTLIALVCALAACTDASTDESSTTTSPGETNDEVGSESTSEATDTSSDTTGSESDTTSETGEPEPAVCGDGLVTGAELCDDGNAIDDDGCSNACEPRPCPLTWERIDEPVTLTTTKLDNTPLAELPNGNIVVGNSSEQRFAAHHRLNLYHSVVVNQPVRRQAKTRVFCDVEADFIHHVSCAGLVHGAGYGLLFNPGTHCGILKFRRGASPGPLARHVHCVTDTSLGRLPALELVARILEARAGDKALARVQPILTSLLKIQPRHLSPPHRLLRSLRRLLPAVSCAPGTPS